MKPQNCSLIKCRWWIVVILLNLVFVGIVQGVDWSNPLTIDPLEEGVTDFLDIDSQLFRTRARSFYDRGEYLEAARFYLAALRSNSEDAINIYNLACCYALLGEAELAAQNLSRALRIGLSDLSNIKEDPDFESVRDHPAFIKVSKGIDQLERDIGKTMYLKACKLIQCRIHLPEDFDPAKAYPLVIALHGSAGNAENMATLWRDLRYHDFILVAPEGAYPRGFNPANAWGSYSWEITTRDLNLWRRGDPLTIDYIVETANYISKKFQITDVYLFGFSQGVAYAYTAAIQHPELFRGVVCFAGILPDPQLPYSLLSADQIAASNQLRVFIAHGLRDRAIDISRSHKARDLLEEYGYDVTFKSFNAGHSIGTAALHKAEKWILDAK